MSYTIQHNQQETRFETTVDGHECTLEYSVDEDWTQSEKKLTVSINRVLVPEDVGGRGIAGELTRFALDHARAQDWAIIARCPYVKVWIDRHPDYADVLA